MLALLALTALAAVPDSVRPIAAPRHAPEEFARWTSDKGAPDALVCEELVEEVLLCFTVVEGSKIRWVGRGDLASWGVDQPQFLERLRTRAAAHVAVELQTQPDLSYWVNASPERWSLAGLLRPDLLAAATTKGDFHAAVPLENTLLVWAPGDDELDQIMAVGAAEMTRKENGAVSSVVLGWDGERWSVYGQAIAGEPPKSPEAPPR